MALSRVYGLIFVFVYSLVFYFVNSSCHEMINLNAAIYIKTNCAPNICTRILDNFVKMLDLNLTNMAVLVNLIFHTSGHNWWPKFEFCMGSFFSNVYFWYEDPFKNLLVLTILFAIWGQNTGFCGHAAICEKMNWQNCWTLSFWRISSLLRYEINLEANFR